MFHVKPIDPRLLHHARATRLFLAAVVALGLVGALLVIAQAMLIAEIVVGGFEGGLTVTALRTPFCCSPRSPSAAPSSPGSPSWRPTAPARPSSRNCAAGSWNGPRDWAPTG